MSHALDDAPAPAPQAKSLGAHAAPVRLSRGVSPTAAWTVFAMTLGRNFRARKLLALVLLYLLPIGIVLLVRHYAEEDDPRAIESVVVMWFLPHGLIPLTALLYAPGLIQDEVEEQTLTYLLIRPLPRWLVYVAKLAATILATAAIAAAFTAATEAAIWWGHEEFRTVVPERSGKLAALFALSLVAYNALFGCVGLIFRRALALGVLYIIAFEGVLANIPFVFRRLTVVYYFRDLALRWIGEREPAWQIDLDAAPAAGECVATLLLASLALTALTAYLFTVREFRVKTPETA